MRLVNRKTYSDKTGWEISIMRPSLLGNPFTVKQYGREGCIAKYQQWLAFELATGNQELRQAMLHFRSETVLVCCCVPDSCHGEVIMEFAEALQRDHHADFTHFVDTGAGYFEQEMLRFRNPLKPSADDPGVQAYVRRFTWASFMERIQELRAQGYMTRDRFEAEQADAKPLLLGSPLNRWSKDPSKLPGTQVLADAAWREKYRRNGGLAGVK